MKKVKTLFETKWLKLKQRTFKGKSGDIQWDYVSRDTKVVTIICRHANQYLLISQYRPPMNGEVLEFPAGLIDKDESLHEAALRELQEETGLVSRHSSIVG